MPRSFAGLFVLGVAGLALAWECPDNGSTMALSNNQVPGNYRVRHSGGDANVRLIVRDASGNVTFDEPLPTNEEGVLVGVPLGGSVEVTDPADGDQKGADGTIAKE